MRLVAKGCGINECKILFDEIPVEVGIDLGLY